MLELKVIEFALECLVLACLAGVILLGKYALTACNARREMTAALPAVNVTMNSINKLLLNLQLSNACLAVLLGAIELLLRFVNGRMSRE